jgi:hypothetical protein
MGTRKKAVTEKIIGLNGVEQLLESMAIHGFYSPVRSVREILYKILK